MSGAKIHRPFFTSSIVTVFSLGCLWGAINLLTIGLRRNFGVISYSWTLAHGHAMVFGFVGLFVMGSVYALLPIFKDTTLWRPKIAISTLPLMLTGIGLQAWAHLSVPGRGAVPLELIAAGLQLLSVFLFALVVVRTNTLSGRKEIYDRFIYAALFWFVVAALANPIIFVLFEFPGSRANLLFNLATFNIPYRDIQILGIAVMMIFGISLRVLPATYGMREPGRVWQNMMFWSLNATVLLGGLLFIAGMATGNHWLLMAQWTMDVMLLAVAIGIPLRFQLFRQVDEQKSDRGLKFIRIAFAWLIVATAMLVFVPLYNFGIYMPLTGSHVPFSHAFFGAYRHAITVGFVMMMIVGMSSRTVPLLAGIAREQTSSLWLPFVLINLGNLLRVTFQIATDFSPAAYRIMGISGFVEVIGLSMWAYELLRNMRRQRELGAVALTTKLDSQTA